MLLSLIFVCVWVLLHTCVDANGCVRAQLYRLCMSESLLIRPINWRTNQLVVLAAQLCVCVRVECPMCCAWMCVEACFRRTRLTMIERIESIQQKCEFGHFANQFVQDNLNILFHILYIFDSHSTGFAYIHTRKYHRMNAGHKLLSSRTTNSQATGYFSTIDIFRTSIAGEQNEKIFSVGPEITVDTTDCVIYIIQCIATRVSSYYFAGNAHNMTVAENNLGENGARVELEICCFLGIGLNLDLAAYLSNAQCTCSLFIRQYTHIPQFILKWWYNTYWYLISQIE